MNICKVDSCIAFLNGRNSPNWSTVVNRLKSGSHIAAICPTLQQHRITHKLITPPGGKVLVYNVPTDAIIGLDITVYNGI